MESQSLWNQVIDYLVNSTQDANERPILELFKSQIALDLTGNTARFRCRSGYIADIFKNFRERCELAVSQIADLPDLEFSEEISEPAPPAPGPQGQAAAAGGPARARLASSIHPEKTFENYVVDPDNQMLYATALAVAKNPGSSNYNPFYIYGASGLGKTHLLFAIANRIRETNPSISVLYTRAEEFIRNYVASMATGTKAQYSDSQVHFQDSYTEHNVFIVDDIQNFVRGNRARDTFFDIIADFLDQPGRQLILASDQPPGDLQSKGFSPRLTSRFGSGVCCEVVPPSLDTRRAIIMRKCEEFDVQMGEDIIEYISNHIRTNVREIEGAIKTLNIQKSTLGRIEYQDAVRILNSMINITNQVVTVDSIKERVSKEFDVTVTAMESAEKKKMVSLARSVAMSLANELIPSLSSSDIGKAFNKDHSSVLEAIKRVSRRRSEDPELEARYHRLFLSLKKD
ncbi:MAG: chromosomal replication initiator protein DnaA [Succinivibrionaceae bacterium]|nr:chromosomal replication initiator protein DnaA [Succinivibrionaceae bacterium]